MFSQITDNELDVVFSKLMFTDPVEQECYLIECVHSRILHIIHSTDSVLEDARALIESSN